MNETVEPSKPRAPLWVRILVWLALLAAAIAAIWWIDRGAMNGVEAALICGIRQ